jgi:HEPN domain-containing protein
MHPREEAKRNLVRQWVAKAEKDLSLAEHLIAEEAPYPEAIAFNAQQAAEKYLKAFLVQHQVEFPKTHNLGELLRLIAPIDPSLAESLADVIKLNPYGVEVRYPGDFPEVATEAVISAVGLAAKVRTAVLALLGPDLTQRYPED